MGVNKTMPTITIDLPDNVSIPHARTFVLEKLHEAGFLPSERTEPSDEKYVPDSWLTPEMKRQAKKNRWRLEEKRRKSPPPMRQEDFLELILNGPVADEETIKRQDEVREHLRQWKIPR
jgi:hypothetical protein